MKDHKPIIIEQTFRKPMETVWVAITELKQMKQWFFENIPEFKPEVGFATKFNVQTPNGDFMHLWKITEVIPDKKITYNWKYEKLPGEGHVTFELFEKNNSTLLQLTNEGLESFPNDIPEFTRESCTQGWNYFIKNRLKDFLNK